MAETVVGAMGTLREFKGGESDWPIFKSRLNQYFIANKIKDAAIQRALLLNACNEESFRLLYSLCLPEIPESKSYQDLVNVLDNHFKPVTSPFPARYKFYNATKHVDESIKDWAARVRNLASTCQFGAELEVVLRDKFIMGLEEKIMERLFEEKSSITFEKAIEIAGCYQEKNEFHVKQEMFYQSQRSNASAIPTRQGRKQLQSQGPAYTRRCRAAPSGGRKLAMTTETEPRQRHEAARRKTACGICGKTNHTKDKCFYKNYTCNSCGLKGHLARLCQITTILKLKLLQNFLM